MAKYMMVETGSVDDEAGWESAYSQEELDSRGYKTAEEAFAADVDSGMLAEVGFDDFGHAEPLASVSVCGFTPDNTDGYTEDQLTELNYELSEYLNKYAIGESAKSAIANAREVIQTAYDDIAKKNFNPKTFFADDDLAIKAYKKAKAEGKGEVAAIALALGEGLSCADGDEGSEGYAGYIYETAHQILKGRYQNIKAVQEELDTIEEEEREAKE